MHGSRLFSRGAALALLALAAACSGSSGDNLFAPLGATPDGGTAQGEGSASSPACRPDEKPCNGGCVRRDDPTFGCGGASCDACSVSHGTATCNASGKCAVGQCEPGRANCTGSATECDAKLASDPENCGECGNKCAADQVCGPQGCTSVCPSALTRCGQSCVDVNADESNCGACGKVCSSPANGSATCTAKKCSVKCNTGYHSCNGATCVAENAASCGASCTVCPGPASGHGAPTCKNGGCGIACDAGYAACALGCCPIQQPCGASNCAGCCANNTCMAGTASSACGVGGAACSVCNGGTTCSAGACKAAPPPDAGGGVTQCNANDPNYFARLLAALSSPTPRMCSTGCTAVQCCATEYNICLDP